MDWVAKAPRESVDTLNGGSGSALANPQSRRNFEQDGIEVFGGTPAQFAERIREYFQPYEKWVKRAGVKEN